MSGIQVVAYYLPQFHPTPENDEWWGKGFTEWVNVAKARPLFRNHRQPHIPADLGFYDLRMPEARAMQAEYAKRAGISAFCYWHYWFGNGKRLLNKPFDAVLRSHEPDFPFCLGWANHSWYKKSWTADKGLFNISQSQLLVEQLYPGKVDYVNHFYTMLPAFNDKRYFCIENRPVFVIFQPLGDYKQGGKQAVLEFMECWQELARKEGMPPFFFIGHCVYAHQLMEIQSMGFDAVNYSMHHMVFPVNDNYSNRLMTMMTKLRRSFSIKPTVIDYADAVKKMDVDIWNEETIFPTLIPNWDHTPRSGNFGRVYINATPQLFAKHAEAICRRVSLKADRNKVVFLKSWNEWGEGNYLEPDLEYGTERIDALAAVLKKYKK